MARGSFALSVGVPQADNGVARSMSVTSSLFSNDAASAYSMRV